MEDNLNVFTYTSNVSEEKIRQLIHKLKNELSFIISDLTVNFVDDETIHRINKDYLEHDYPTDIITFNYSGSHSDLDGEIFISFETAIENSKNYQVQFNEELTRLVIHGILHLVGYNDLNEKDKKEMRVIENQLLMSYKFILLGEN